MNNFINENFTFKGATYYDPTAKEPYILSQWIFIYVNLQIV